MNIQAALLEEFGGELEIRDIEVEQPAAGEVLVRIAGTGICLSDLHGRAGEFGTPPPLILGHEGSGTVEAVGPGVSKVAPGDHVVLSVDSCGVCRQCDSGAPKYCRSFIDLNLGEGLRESGGTGYTMDGTVVHGRFSGQSTFATHSLVSQRSVVKVPKQAPLDILGPFGCAVQTGAGAIANVLGPEPGESIAIYGVGSVGLCALMMAKALGCSRIVAVDVNGARLDLASDLGATDLVNPNESPVVESVRAATGSLGTDHAMDSTGLPEVIADATAALGSRGRLAMLGVPGGDGISRIDLGDMLFNGKVLVGSIMGDAVSDVFIPRLIDLFERGEMPVDRLISRFEFSQINEAMHAVERGEVIKALVAMP